MPDLPTILAAGLLVSLILYTLLGGADFGGGVWGLFSSGPRGPEQRAVVARAIGPVWETNHIWVIIAVVILFTGFPKAFALISTALFVPISLLLAGIVLRGAAFAFHSYRLHEGRGRGRWGTVFSAASLLTPVLLGTTVGAVSTGKIRAESIRLGASNGVWLAPFPLLVGLFTLAIFAYLAAVYLIMETRSPDLREDFRSRGIASAIAVSALSVAVPLAARSGAPEFHAALFGSDTAVAIAVSAAAATLGAFVSLMLRAFQLARVLAAAQAALILAGWGLAQFPYIVRPDLTVSAAASPHATLRAMIYALGAGATVLFPAVGYLFRVFKKEALFGSRPSDAHSPTLPR